MPAPQFKLEEAILTAIDTEIKKQIEQAIDKAIADMRGRLQEVAATAAVRVSRRCKMYYMDQDTLRIEVIFNANETPPNNS